MQIVLLHKHSDLPGMSSVGPITSLIACDQAVTVMQLSSKFVYDSGSEQTVSWDTYATVRQVCVGLSQQINRVLGHLKLLSAQQKWRTCTSFLVSFSSSLSLNFLGSTVTPPLAPPNGMSMTAVFQVIKLARLHAMHYRLPKDSIPVACVVHLTCSPSDIIKINLRMISESSFERTSTIVVLNTICIETFYLAIILSDDELYKDLPRRSEK